MNLAFRNMVADAINSRALTAWTNLLRNQSFKCLNLHFF